MIIRVNGHPDASDIVREKPAERTYDALCIDEITIFLTEEVRVAILNALSEPCGEPAGPRQRELREYDDSFE